MSRAGALRALALVSLVVGAATPAAATDEMQTSLSKAEMHARTRCGCASSRLLRDGAEVRLDSSTGLAAWVRTDGSASLEYFRRDADTGALTGVHAPLRQERFSFEGSNVPSSHALVQVVPTAGAPEAFYVGVLLPPRTVPGDVVLVEAASQGAPPPGPPPALSAVWVGALAERAAGTCGQVRSRRVQVELDESGPALAAWIVSWRPEGEAERSTLVDERHARFFGLGRVGPCDHGMPFDARQAHDGGPGGQGGELVLRPVSAAFGVGEPWRFAVPADDGALPTLVTGPDGARQKPGDNPFLREPRDPLHDLLSDDKDHAAFGMMALVVLGAGAFAWIFYTGRRRRRRHLVTLGCPACEAELTIDLNAPETDGMFCPKCGRSSVFVAYEADGTPRASVFPLTT